MTSAREEILGRIRAAKQDLDLPPVEVDWVYGRTTGDPVHRDHAQVVDLFVERVEDYQAVVDRAGAAEVPGRMVAALQRYGATSVVLPAGLPDDVVAAIRDAGVEVREDDHLSPAQLDEIGAVVTTSAVGFAETGTIVLDHGPGQGRRALTLVPDIHVCLVRADQVTTDVPEGLAREVDSIRAGQPQTWISGPSATSDIELSRVEGVHGPRTLHVVVSEG